MRVIPVHCVLFCYFGSLRTFVHSTDWVDDLTRCIVESSKFRLVKLLTRLEHAKFLEDPLTDEFLAGLMQQLPLLRIDFKEDFELPANSVPDETSWERTPIDTTATLFLLVVESPDASSAPMIRDFIETVANMATYHYNPKYLALFFVRKRSDSLEEILQFAWTQKMLDFTLLELAHPGVSKFLGANGSAPVVPLVHQLNPFKKEYSRTPWKSRATDLFPDKVSDLWGFPVRVKAINHPPFSVAKFNGLEEPTEIGGANLFLIQTLLRKLNATVKYFPAAVERNASNVLRSLYSVTELQKIDISSTSSASYTVSWNDTQRTAPILVDKFCALVPILPKLETLVSTSFFLANLSSFSLILFFWIFARFMRFESPFWKLFDIGCVLFGVSTTRQPRANVERITFACLLAISAIYSSTIYSSITDISLQKNGEVEFESFQDLIASGLVPHMHPFEIDRTAKIFQGADHWKDYKKITVRIFNSLDCVEVAVKHKNVTCFMKKIKARYVIDKSMGHGKAILKVAEPCFWTESFSFLLGKRSPYRWKLDKLISRLHRAGIVSKFYRDDISNGKKLSYEREASITEEQESMLALRYQLMSIAIVGYSISIAAFVLEIIYHRITVYRKSKLRPIGLLPYTE
ncbi:uncharacterized protein [Venturia canescens]|uniref:uncharacterized protein n=1 Tax=Venturia canescens TaxID=32260 RepID=UPI001C9C3E1B|nr:uncharacterized protein LOC122413645 [Venturia canescens]